MGAVDRDVKTHLILGGLRPDPKTARRLPASVAWRYHALPIVEEEGHITVAMAEPEDASARQAIAAALDPSATGDQVALTVVRSDPISIDEVLAELWPEATAKPVELWVYAGSGKTAHEVVAYSRYLSQLLGADLKEETGEPMGYANGAYPILVLLGQKGSVQTLRQLEESGAWTGISVLMALRPRWPLHKLLVDLGQDPAADDPVLNWTVRLARASQAQVTILTVVPPVPYMYSGFRRMGHDLAELLSTDTELGSRLRRAARWLSEWDIHGTLRLRQGAPRWEVQREAMEGDYDMAVVGAGESTFSFRAKLANLDMKPLSWSGPPLLLARVHQWR